MQISRVGTGYTLRFIAVNAFNTPIAFTFSDEFVVTLGDPYTLVLDPNMGPFLGGLPFGIQPSVIITDRGGNTITSIDEGTVSAELYSTPYPDEVLLTNGTKTATFSGGVAQFEGLYLNLQGGGYELVFNSSLVCLVVLWVYLLYHSFLSIVLMCTLALCIIPYMCVYVWCVDGLGTGWCQRSAKWRNHSGHGSPLSAGVYDVHYLCTNSRW